MRTIGMKLTIKIAVIASIVLLTASFLEAPLQSSVFTFVTGSVMGAHIFRKVKNNRLAYCES